MSSPTRAVRAGSHGRALWTTFPTSAKISRMAQSITTGYKALLAAAEAEIETIPTGRAVALFAAGAPADTVLVDLRDPRELEREGRMPGAVHCPRGMLEFWIDPESPYAKPIFQEDKKFVFFCAGGWRSALAAKAAQDMGLRPVAHIAGGFKAWREAGGPVEAAADKKPSATT
jgi:rhodanese-related sulfurtransferase